MAFSATTAVELWGKVFNAKVSKRANAETVALLNTFRVLPFKGDAAQFGGMLLQTAREKGRPIGWADNMLAAYALALDATVVTDNTKDFAASGGKLENWR